MGVGADGAWVLNLLHGVPWVARVQAAKRPVCSLLRPNSYPRHAFVRAARHIQART